MTIEREGSIDTHLDCQLETDTIGQTEIPQPRTQAACNTSGQEAVRHRTHVEEGSQVPVQDMDSLQTQSCLKKAPNFEEHEMVNEDVCIHLEEVGPCSNGSLVDTIIGIQQRVNP